MANLSNEHWKFLWYTMNGHIKLPDDLLFPKSLVDAVDWTKSSDVTGNHNLVWLSWLYIEVACLPRLGRNYRNQPELHRTLPSLYYHDEGCDSSTLATPTWWIEYVPALNRDCGSHQSDFDKTHPWASMSPWKNPVSKITRSILRSDMNGHIE